MFENWLFIDPEIIVGLFLCQVELKNRVLKEIGVGVDFWFRLQLRTGLGERLA